MKIGRNDPCPCGSRKKYKKCCLDTNKSIDLGRQLHLKGKNAENFVYELAKKSFLTDWCYKNPKLPNGKELCDLLVIYDGIAIIWQIKDIKLNREGKFRNSEIKNNLQQLSTARRRLFELNLLIELENPRRRKEKFNPKVINEIYLVSALLGEVEDHFSFTEEIKGKVVHTFTREFTELALNELDTIKDFIEYLRKKEELLSLNNSITLFGGEKELLAFYLMNEHSFERFKGLNLIMVQEGCWDELQKKPEYIAKKEENRISYGWDSMIDRAHEGGSEYEKIARELAHLNRFERRCLSKAYFEAHVMANNETKNNTSRRMIQFKGTTYCFVFLDDNKPKEMRKKMLQAICFVARNIAKNNKKVIGIATEMKIRPTCSYDFCLLDFPEWTNQNKKETERLQKKLGIFVNPQMKYAHEDEYPNMDN